ncbi:MAG: hypothetical protein IPN90_00055 [Elusimicrobia bacterium]|nr:hypothetical protein [Elusimicrobiota bacterium]
MLSFRTLLLLSVFGAGAWVCHADDGVLPATASAVLVSTPPAAPAYVFRGDRFRDPFLPLLGAPGGGFDIPRSLSEPLSPFNPVGADLKGILKTTTGRWALIRTSEGVTYLVQNGKIFDPKRKAVEGYQGIVKEKTVVILGPKNQEVEIRLKKRRGRNEGLPLIGGVYHFFSGEARCAKRLILGREARDKSCFPSLLGRKWREGGIRP